MWKLGKWWLQRLSHLPKPTQQASDRAGIDGTLVAWDWSWFTFPHDALHSFEMLFFFFFFCTEIRRPKGLLRWLQWLRTYLSMQETSEMHIQSLGREDPLEEGMATHSSILAWRISWTEEPGRLQSMGSQRVGHEWNDLACTHAIKPKGILSDAGGTWILGWK